MFQQNVVGFNKLGLSLQEDNVITSMKCYNPDEKSKTYTRSLQPVSHAISI